MCIGARQPGVGGRSGSFPGVHEGARVALSQCVLSRRSIRGGPRVSLEGAHVGFVCDPRAVSELGLCRFIDSARTRLVLQDGEGLLGTAPPSGVEIVAKGLQDEAHSLARVAAVSLSEAVFGADEMADLVLLGVALQLGWLPLPVASVECAIRDVGGGVERQLMALRLGRAAVVDPGRAEAWIASARPGTIGDGADAESIARLPPAAWTEFQELLSQVPGPAAREASDLRNHVASYAADLADAAGLESAGDYLGRLTELLAAELRVGASTPSLTQAAARELYRVMAPADVYEIARLLLRGPFRRWVDARIRRGTRVRYRVEHPIPGSRGHARVWTLPRWLADPLLQVLLHLRGLRATPFDPFASGSGRSAKAELRSWYPEMLRRLSEQLRQDSLDRARALVGATSELSRFGQREREHQDRVRSRVEGELAALESSGG